MTELPTTFLPFLAEIVKDALLLMSTGILILVIVDRRGGVVELRNRIAELEAIINTPMIDDFVEAAANEARHQIDRWGDKHDAVKSADDWRNLLGHLTMKAVDAFERGDHAKGMHHIISSAAVLAHWHRHASKAAALVEQSRETRCRPTPPPAKND